MVGAGTHPGAGIPGVLTSAKLLDKVIPTPQDIPNKSTYVPTRTAYNNG